TCISLISSLLPVSITSPTFSPLGARIYLFSPSAYATSAIYAVLFGSYSIVCTLAGILSLSLLRSIILYLLLTPPPRNLTVVLPVLFLPPLDLRSTVRLFSGLSVVISSNVETDIFL